MIRLPIAAEPARGPALIASLLEEQRSLTAVESFCDWHAKGVLTDLAEQRLLPSSSERYRALLPATPPEPGQQYAFEVDLDRCSGCKACVVACHALNGLDEQETWRDVGLLIGGTRTAPVIQHVTAACHHCLQPACMNACPVNAYEKDPITGIVKHLDDQCFGCQYCTLACPYDVPKYHSGKGIIRKCDMCSSRLAVGEPPACVQACPSEAIAIRLVEREQVIDEAEASNFLPAAPDPQITLPTTTYKTRRPFPRNLLPADYTRVNPQHAHWPLVVMLVLTQLSVGAFTVGLILELCLDQQLLATLLPIHAAAALGFGLLALGASLLHLGRPHLAFRAVLGLRHSWLSREIVAFGAFSLLALLYSITVFLARGTEGEGNSDPTFSIWIRWLGWSVAVSGAGAVFCSTMIYVFTQRDCWSFPRVIVRFLLTCAILGVAAVWLSVVASTFFVAHATLHELVRHCGPLLCQALMSLVVTKLLIEASDFRHLLSRQMTPLRRSALLMTRELSNPLLARFALSILGGVLLAAMLAGKAKALSDGTDFIEFVVVSGLLFTTCLAGELLERYLFFAACAAPRMPGGIR